MQQEQAPYHFETQKLVSHLYRQWYGKMVTSLARYFGLQQLELAEDIVQEAFESAIRHWEQKGMPDQPVNWLFKVCKNKAINALRKKRFEPLPAEFFLNTREEIKLATLFLDNEIEDSQLRMIVACCHPAFSVKNQLIFVLRHVAGLTVRQIARGLLMTEESVAKSVVRSKQLIREKNLSFPDPDYLKVKEKLDEVHLIIYLLFNEGYSSTDNDSIIREELCFEAIRLIKLVTDNKKLKTADSSALFSLFLLHAARFPAREDIEKKLIDLESQDRRLWDQEMIALGQQYFRESIQEKNYSKYQVEAAIAYEHAQAPSFEETDWASICELYEYLLRSDPSATIQLNWLIAIFYSQGPLFAYEKLHELDAKGSLVQNQYYFSLLGKIYMAMDDTTLAASCFRQAIELTTSLPEKKYIERLLATL
ncbi:MAG: sigma-70 family RNA polymerase sigma factor [Imperialibacter sp.]|uniref:RNA polymerase sigma factor n=1 Tax=Imperialibacter sp. TaxID=2038411 RepID=UPI0032F038E6